MSAIVLPSKMVQAESAMQELVRRARTRFAIGTADDALIAEVTRNAEEGVALSDELVLAAACLLGDPEAIRILDREYGRELRALIG